MSVTEEAFLVSTFSVKMDKFCKKIRQSVVKLIQNFFKDKIFVHKINILLCPEIQFFFANIFINKI